MESEGLETVDATGIGQRYIEHLIGEGKDMLCHGLRSNELFAGDFTKAAKLFSKVCGQDTKRWEDWIFVFAQKQQLQVRIRAIENNKIAHL